MCRLLAIVAVAGAAFLPLSTTHSQTAPDFRAFAGPWQHHTTRLWVGADGFVTEWDHSANAQNADVTFYAQVTAIVGNTAYGTDANGDPIWLVLLPNDMLLYEDTLTQAGSVFCGTGGVYDTTMPGMYPWPCGT